VVLNLVRNGIEALAESPGPRRLMVVSAVSSSGVELYIEDTGPGLTAPQQDRVFDTFFTTKRSGLGMGLSISRTIVEAHGGRLVAVPCPSGARFRVTLPFAPPPDEEEASSAPGAAGGKDVARDRRAG
jgi:two-component system sensor kinase FixL